ncbi:alpha/beta hydrolase [Flavobacterium sp. TSSA_36]|uniref:alpha/beta hydrolase n=1 Tax=Flavobacterium sp. TSSA_36 TaxID=3447669 RepID=UPI003F2A37FD
MESIQNNIVYTEDHLGQGFESATLEQANDYEGRVITTLIRKQYEGFTEKAVLYIHGFNDYFFQTEMGLKFNEKGFHFYALDLRKYGRSFLPHQKMNTMRSLTEYFADLDLALQRIKNEGNTKVLLSGHSTGGLLVTLYAAARKGSEKFEALYCNSPFYEMNMSQFHKRFLIPWVALLGRNFPDIKIPGKISHWYGHSLHVGQKGEWNYNLTWKPHLAPSVNAGWINAIHQGHLKIKKGVQVSQPILIMHSHQSIYSHDWSPSFFKGDAILNVKDIQAGAEKIEAPQRVILEITNGMHDLILSPMPARERVYSALFEWLEQIMK